MFTSLALQTKQQGMTPCWIFLVVSWLLLLFGVVRRLPGQAQSVQSCQNSVILLIQLRLHVPALYLNCIGDFHVGAANPVLSQILFSSLHLSSNRLHWLKSILIIVVENILALPLFFTQNDVAKANDFPALAWFG